MAPNSPWPVVALESVATEITVGHVGPMAREYIPAGVPFLRSTNIRPYRIDRTDIRYIGADFHRRLKKSELRPGDVVVVRTGAPGTAAVVPPSLPEANCADLVIIRPSNRIDGRFLVYLLNSVSHRHVQAQLVGAVQQHFNIGSARKLPLPLPPIAEQSAIADVLGGLDDKIELNREMNRTLEETAQALFCSWFVDFDPVVAKADRQMPLGMSDETAALFPSQFEDSELGPVPERWQVKPLGRTFALRMGQSPPGSTYNTDGRGLPFYQGSTDFGERFPERRVYCIAPTRIAQAGDTLVSVRAPVGAINMAAEGCALGRGVAALRHVSGGRSYTFYAAGALTSELAVFNAQGTVFGAINKGELASRPVIEPPLPVVAAFEQSVGALDELILNNWGESRTLAELRDLLLPKLLSGEIRVGQAERAVEAAL